ncbi:response regulator transcription factor [Paenibacillus sp. PAMC21692]|uniref:response regulator transcription factor n=1 Tax=Paenibacillus sp. PAMC21692 TaxID=2762320 RepID=UPI00164DCD54|nr:response regulator transcription factor [Paenibacillus sp. PAMC21692]QNK57457.1 response regulator transcription factor [Paenibacillus sp. PAMC21692]
MTVAIIVDDEELAIQRLSMLLAETGEIDVCRTFLNPAEAYEYVVSHPVDIVFLDIYMPEISGMNFCSLLLELHPHIGVVFVTGYNDYAVEAFELSALDYLKKPVTEQRLAKTLDKIRKKQIAASLDLHRPNTEARTANDTPEKTHPKTAALTEKEIKVLRLMTKGLSNKEIADQLNIAAETVKWHLKNAYRKLNVSNRVQALQRVKELHIFEE